MRWSLPLACVLTLSACAATPPVPPAAVPVPGPSAAARSSGVLLGNIDPGVRPQDDFYRYVNGRWLATTEIPADKPRYGAWVKLRDDVQASLRAIVEEAAAAGAATGSDAQLLGDFYASFMDEATIERRGLAPIEPELARIAAIDDRPALLAYLARATLLGIPNPIATIVEPDAKHPDRYTVWSDQSGLAMPDRDYYLEDDARFAGMRAQYLAYVAEILSVAGREDAPAAAARVLAFETRLARASWSQVDLRDVDKIYNPFDVAAATRATPGIDWARYLDALGAAGHDHLVIGEPSYFVELGRMLAEVPLVTWKDYLQVRAIDAHAPYLGDALVQKHFDFHGRTLSGTPEIRPRWQRGLAETEAALGDLLGKAYVARHFPPLAKRRMDALVANLLESFGSSIDELEWMGADTRSEAHEKLRRIAVKVGYPERWKDYQGLVIRRDDLVGNVHRAREVDAKRRFARLGGPVDRTEWSRTPQTVNAYYNPLGNEIVFPAAILQPPFFDMNADDAINYGAIGALIGHEISHGFDDQGRKFDGTGALRDWWTAEDSARFEASTRRLVEQYSAFSPLPGMQVNGELTLGENIGDVSGVAVAYKAYQRTLGGEPAPTIDGYTGDQRFFIGWAQIWLRKYRDDEARKRLLTDPHSPPEYRCNGVVRNLPAFARAFDVQPGDGLYLPSEQVVRIW
jgi:putative endopeptidase